MPMPAFAPALREVEEGACAREAGGRVLDAEVGRVLIENTEDAEDMEDVEDVKDEAMLLVGEVEEPDAVELDAPCTVRDSGEGA